MSSELRPRMTVARATISGLASGCAMSDHHFVVEVPALDEPVLVVMLTGWIDASGAAAAAMSGAGEGVRRRPSLVAFDDDTYIDYRARRPMLELRDGVNTRLVWSVARDARRPRRRRPRRAAAQRSRAGHGVAPLRRHDRRPRRAARRRHAWRRSAPTRSPRRTPGRRTSRRRRRRPTCWPSCRSAPAPSTCPAGMAAALEQSVHERGIPALGIWAQVPHYVSSMSYPAASVALLEGLATATGDQRQRQRAAPRVGPPAGAPRPARRRQRRAPGDGRAVRAALRRRRGGRDGGGRARPTTRRPHDGAEVGEIELRSGDELAAEVERFLRDQGKS